MTGDSAIPVSPGPKNFAGHDCSGHKAAANAASMLRAAASEGCADEVPTPFFDILTTMIKAHAAESGRELQKTGPTNRRHVLPNIACSSDSRRTDVNAARSWRAPRLNVSIVGLIVVVSSMCYASEASKEQPRGIAADQASQARSVASAIASANDERIEKPIQAAESDRLPTMAVQKPRTDGGEIVSERASGADATDQAVVMPVVGQPVDKIVSDTEFRADGAAGERTPSEVVRAAPVAAATRASAEEPSRASAEEPSKAAAEEPSRRDVLSPPPLAAETRSSIGRSHDPVAIHIGRVISGANMRAGPSNAQPVLATIPRGSTIEVVKCRHWCEVNFGGQRGWVYKSFIRAPVADVAISPTRAKSSPPKAGSKSGALRGTRTRASVPTKFKPSKTRLPTDRRTRDALGRTESSSDRPIFLGAIVSLWKQITPSALWPNSD
jgi:uncharacterized protein YraI